MVDQTQLTSIKITSALEVHGWDHLDAVLLAALATQAPLLLVGPHGTAKSLLVEKIADALTLEMRHYNASLLNYDDLVGIPLPDESGQSLRFVPTPGSIWDAGFVFFDEISRCRADLQNKLFPIIHERKIVGIPLENLRHRWAAMNPPAPEEMDGGSPGEYYLGSEPLDPALADRFPFVVPVPDWRNLSNEDRRHLVRWKNGTNNAFESYTGQQLSDLIDRATELITKIEEEYSDWLTDYIIYVIDLLDQAKLPQSPRRANMLARNVAAVHAARIVLEGEDDVDLESSAHLALLYGLPQSASEVPPSQATVIATHRQAWEIASLADNDHWRQLLQEPDAVQRVILADELGFSDEEISPLITQALASEDSDARQVGLATAMFLAFRDCRNLLPSAWEPLAKLARQVIEPRAMTTTVTPGFLANLWKELLDWRQTLSPETSDMDKLYANFVMSGYPDRWKTYKWQDELERFRTDLLQFGIKEKE